MMLSNPDGIKGRACQAALSLIPYQSNDLGEAILRYLRRRRGADTKYADLWVAMKHSHKELRSITAEEFRRVIQRLVRDVLVEESGAGATRIIRIPASTTPTGGSALGDESEEDEDQDGDVAKKSGSKSSSEDGLEAKSPGQAHKFRQPSRVEKFGNSRQPNRMIVDRRQDPETSWVGPVAGNEKAASESESASDSEAHDDAEVEEPPPAKGSRGNGGQNASAKRGSSRKQQQQPVSSPAKTTRKRKAARIEDPAGVEEGMFSSSAPSKARNANLYPDNEDEGPPPSKRTKKSTPKSEKSKE
jgi:hypothetical protein